MQLGLENFLEQRSPELEGVRFAVLANRASVDSALRFTWDRLAGAFPGQLQAIFAPQHGLWGDAQANMVESLHGWNAQWNVPVYSLYSETRRPTARMLEGIECLIVDLQDIGTRVYTFAWTLVECLRACADAGTDLIVFDRPNPLGGRTVEGPLLEPGYISFVGGAPIPMRHGLTFAELAQFLNEHLGIGARLRVVEMAGWDAEAADPLLGHPWVPPSPNLPTQRSTLCYPGLVLLEGTNISEGRGTTTPFEVLGAPFIDPIQLIDGLGSQELPGVKLLPTFFRPTFDKWAGELCGGVSLHVVDSTRFRPYHTAVRLLAAIRRLWPTEFQWLAPPYEYEREKPPIDIISGSSQLRETLDNASPDDASLHALIRVDARQWSQRAARHLLYPRPAGFMS